jgi:hypothetical protein
MISETIELVTDALKNQTYGVNTYLSASALPRVEGVYSEITDYWVTIGGQPEKFPVIIVSLAEDVNFLMPEIRTSIRDVEITLAVSYWNKIVDSATGIDLSYKTLAAVMKALRTWSKNENAADRIDGSIQIMEMTTIRQTPRAVNQDQDVNLLASLVITFRVRDTNP